MVGAVSGDVVVLLPGILGSVLQRDGHDVWAPTAGGVSRALWSLGRSVTDLRLDADPPDVDDLGDGVVATRLMPDVHIIPGLWAIDGYSALSAMLVSTFDLVPGRTFIEFPYDWRRDNRVAARRLASVALPALHRQRQENPAAKLVLIGHSMGGLVARYFLECLDGWRDTRMLITLGTPYRGSLNALDFLANGFAKKIGPFKVADLSAMLRSFTSIYQLLPIYPCVDAGTGKLTRVADSSGLPDTVVNSRVVSAERDFHRAIEAAVGAHDGAASYVIHPVVGLTQPTLQSARLVDGRVEMLRSFDGSDLDGDGTVPRVSATPIEYDGRRPDPSVYAPEQHGSLQNALSVQTQIHGLLSPVEGTERFRDSRGGLRLLLEDLHETGAEIAVTVVAGVRRSALVTTVVDLDTRRPVAGPLPLRPDDDQLTHTAVIPPLAPGCYRLDVMAVGAASGTVQPVRGLFLVVDDSQPV